MPSDVEINEILSQNKTVRDEERAVRSLIRLSETDAEEFEELQDICNFLNQFEITVGAC